MEEYIGYILTGGVAAAAVKLIDNIIQWALRRKAAKKDAAANKELKSAEQQEQELDDMKSQIKALTHGQMAILHDRIKYLGRGYIQAGSIDLDDRADIVKMHDIYYQLGGNGNLRKLMDDVLALPLRHRGK